MSISKYPSKLSLPQNNPGTATVLEYLIMKFPDIAPDIWRLRVADGKVHWHDGALITADSPFVAQQRVYYYREVETEANIPFTEDILFQDEHILVAYKPHFMAVTPGGIHIKECLQNRLRDTTGLEDLQALHRLDRATAGLVLFSVNPETRHLYHDLFNSHQIHKTYQAIAQLNHDENGITQNLTGQSWEIQNRLVKSQPSFLMKIVEGVANSHSRIRCLAQSAEQAKFELNPITGKTHQLRVHMQTIGYPLLHDNYYPSLQPKSPDDYSRPLQLFAKELRFVDPVSHQSRVFTSDDELNLE